MSRNPWVELVSKSVWQLEHAAKTALSELPDAVSKAPDKDAQDAARRLLHLSVELRDALEDMRDECNRITE